MSNPFRHFPILRRTLFELARKRLRIQGEVFIPTTTPYLIIANHQSYLDPPIIGVTFIPRIKKKIWFLTKQGVTKEFGPLSRWLGMIEVHPEKKAESLIEAEQRLAEGDPLCIFPEGGRNYDHRVLTKGKTGAARLALTHGLPVLPVGITVPDGRTTKESIRDFFFTKKPLVLRIGQPLVFAHHEEITREALEESTRTMMQAVGALCGKVYPY